MITSKIQEITTELFQRGNLSYALQPHQKDLHDLLWERTRSPARKVAVNCSRRFTKTSTSLVFAFEYCIKNQNSSIIFCAPIRSEIKTIVKTIVYAHILRNVLPDCQPTYIESRHEFVFSNGSSLRMYGANSGNIDSARGHTADIIIADEFGQFDNAEYCMTSVLYPMTLTTRGLIIALSTPAPTTDHYFYQYCQECKQTNSYFEKTIHDNTSLSQRDIDEIAEMCGGYQSTAFKREFLVQWVRDEQRVIIPEYDKQTNSQYNKTEYYPLYYHFTSMDFGARDKTAILFATWDFLQQKLYVESEIIINGYDVTVDKIATLCKDQEETLWQNSQNIIRTGDSSDIIVIQTLASQYGYNIAPIKKSSLAEMVSEVRTNIDSIIINPTCTHLINDLEDSIWDEQRKQFQRTHRGHADALASLIYLWRIAKPYRNSNPIPKNHNVTFNQVRYNKIIPSEPEYEQIQVWKQALKRK